MAITRLYQTFPVFLSHNEINDLLNLQDSLGLIFKQW